METGEQVSQIDEALAPEQVHHARNTRKRSIIIFSISSLLCLGLLALLWVQLLTPAQSQNQDSTVLGTTTTNDALVGQTAPNFTLEVLTGQNKNKLSLADFKGKPVVINFW